MSARVLSAFQKCFFPASFIFFTTYWSGWVFFNDNHGAWETVGFIIHRYIQYGVVLACSQAVTIIPAHFGIFRRKSYLNQKPFFIVAFKHEVLRKLKLCCFHQGDEKFGKLMSVKTNECAEDRDIEYNRCSTQICQSVSQNLESWKRIIIHQVLSI